MTAPKEPAFTTSPTAKGRCRHSVAGTSSSLGVTSSSHRIIHDRLKDDCRSTQVQMLALSHLQALHAPLPLLFITQRDLTPLFLGSLAAVNDGLNNNVMKFASKSVSYIT
jgi:hypothetical protein